ncbi:MAG: hypothetical protein OEY89_06560 [Gammaproteobacteria bacterium]|nr:hypothetical protein [Gammaproteobacteria bacterium]
MFCCPYCEKPGISVSHKLIMSPGSRVTCQTCGEISRVSAPAWLTDIFLGAVMMLASFFVDSELIKLILGSGGFVMMMLLPFIFTPLCKVS